MWCGIKRIAGTNCTFQLAGDGWAEINTLAFAKIGPFCTVGDDEIFGAEFVNFFGEILDGERCVLFAEAVAYQLGSVFFKRAFDIVWR